VGHVRSCVHIYDSDFFRAVIFCKRLIKRTEEDSTTSHWLATLSDVDYFA
jgi:hypothetical protein